MQLCSSLYTCDRLKEKCIIRYVSRLLGHQSKQSQYTEVSGTELDGLTPVSSKENALSWGFDDDDDDDV